MDFSMPGSPVLHYLPEFAQIHGTLSWYPTFSSSLALFSCLQSFPASGSFPMNQLFPSGGQSIGVVKFAWLGGLVFSEWGEERREFQ